MAKHKKDRVYSAYSDEELVVILKLKNHESEIAFTEIYDRYSGSIHAYCSKIFSNHQIAEDIFQDTFIKFFQNIKPEFNGANLLGYLITIARNLSLNYKRDTRPTVEIEGMDFVDDDKMNYENDELLGLITMALYLLDLEYREAFVLREYEGLPYEEIASTCNITVTNAKSRVFRAKQKIKDILAPYLKDLVK